MKNEPLDSFRAFICFDGRPPLFLTAKRKRKAKASVGGGRGRDGGGGWEGKKAKKK